jgi:FlaA1/EpsC-like NDP-sugar epimerase
MVVDLVPSPQDVLNYRGWAIGRGQMATLDPTTRSLTETMWRSEASKGRSWFGRVGRVLERYRLPIQLALDLLAWAVGLYGAMVLRFDSFVPGGWNAFGVPRLLAAIVVAACCQTVAGLCLGLYLGRWQFGTLDEVSHLVASVAITTLALAAIDWLNHPILVPMSVTIAGGTIALILMSAPRYAWRLTLERQMRPSGDGVRRALIFGAGEGGTQTITAMLRNPTSPYLPVAMLDDDPAKRNLRRRGVRVMGGRDDLGRVAEECRATTLVLAMPGASSELLRELCDLGTSANLEILVLPPITELFGGPIGVGDIRPLNDADLLGRHAIDTDVDAIASYLSGRRVLVTGAGGSIGSELCHQISRFAPDSLVLVDRDESALHALQLRLDGRAMLDSRQLVVADLRDADRMLQVFAEHRPQVVFHAAALKHLPLLEMHPSEAVKTNVEGTANVIAAARSVEVDRFVNISTDKAADPISVLGYTKRICERLIAAATTECDGTYLSVRFGNVLGSRGSVLTAFHAQIDAGGPITVTDPDVTRYFMTVEEAVQLVIQAGAVGQGGEALVLDMGEPVRIDDVARRLAAQAPRPIEIVYTGMRPGEKLHEVLLGQGEFDRRPSHPQISQVLVPPLHLHTVRSMLPPGLDDPTTVERLRLLVGIDVQYPQRAPVESGELPA